MKTVSKDLLERYFDKEPGQEAYFRVKDEVRRLIVFRRLNLMDQEFPFHGPFDFIFCRNAMIYFDPSTQKAVEEKLLKFLEPGRYLFIGHSENLRPEFRECVEVISPSMYRKIK